MSSGLGSYHPPEPQEVSALVGEMCTSINSTLSDQTAVKVSAYALWRLNWIHPFTEGNGATARGLCYLILNVGLGLVLPGYQTVPELLRNDRAAYYDALADADRRYSTKGEPDVSRLVDLLNRLLTIQLESSFINADDTGNGLEDLVSRRVLRLAADTQTRLYGSAKPSWRTWAIGDYTILQVGTPADISGAEYRHGSFGDPFPSLLARPGERASMIIEAADSPPPILRDLKVRWHDGPALSLERNASAAIQQPEITGDVQEHFGWSLDGTLYVARRGFELSLENLAETLEPLVVRHASASA